MSQKLRDSLAENGTRNSKVSRTVKSNGQTSLMVRFWRWKMDQQMRTGEISGTFARSPTDITEFIREDYPRKENYDQNNKFFKKEIRKGKNWYWGRVA